jgi:hypothetical protein
MRKKLSPEQDRILRELVLYTAEHHRQPSYAELAEACGLASVQRQIDRIAACGWIRVTGLPRGIEIPQDVYEEIVADKEDRT